KQTLLDYIEHRPPYTMYVLPHLEYRARDRNPEMSRVPEILAKDFQRSDSASHNLNHRVLVVERSHSKGLVLLWLYLLPTVFGSLPSCRRCCWERYYPVHPPTLFLR